MEVEWKTHFPNVLDVLNLSCGVQPDDVHYSQFV